MAEATERFEDNYQRTFGSLALRAEQLLDETGELRPFRPIGGSILIMRLTAGFFEGQAIFLASEKNT